MQVEAWSDLMKESDGWLIMDTTYLNNIMDRYMSISSTCDSRLMYDDRYLSTARGKVDANKGQTFSLWDSVDQIKAKL